MIKSYYYLTKPGIVYGNSLSVIAGFFLASKTWFDPMLFVATLLGLALIMASGCVFNNYIDRDIDEQMERTKRRALVTKKIPVKNALFFATLLAFFGFGTLYNFTNSLTAFIAFIGFFFYVAVYSPYKRKSVYGTLVGSISGAVPPVVGYVAVSNQLDMAALCLFILLVLWQMPHFYSIAIFRLNDYKAAAIPVLPAKQGVRVAKIHILAYIFAFMCALPLLTLFNYKGYIYLGMMLIMSLVWFAKGVVGFKTENDTKWARGMFKFSLLVLLTLCTTIAINSI